MSDTKPSYRLKIDRARQHVVEITQKLNEFLNLKPYSVYIDDTDNSMRRWRVKIKHHIPLEWSPIIGDALHNARSALDLLATAIALKNDPSRSNLSGINFIITRNMQEFEDAAKGTSWLRREDIDALKKLEPYKSGNTNLWRLHRLNIVDKHRSLIPIGGACTRFNFPFEIFGYSIIRSESFSPFDGVMRTFPLPPKMIPVSLGPDKRVFPLSDNQEILSNPFREKFDKNYEFYFEILLKENGIIDGEPVDTTLCNLIDAAERVIDVAENEILFC